MFNKITLHFFTWANRMKPSQDEIARLRTTIGIITSGMGICFALTLGIPVYLYGEPLAGPSSFWRAGYLSARSSLSKANPPWHFGRISILLD